jgi:hypothetical protein
MEMGSFFTSCAALLFCVSVSGMRLDLVKWSGYVPALAPGILVVLLRLVRRLVGLLEVGAWDRGG